MPSYLDRTFCNSNCLDSTCPRFLSEKVLKGAVQTGLPIAQSDYSKCCEYYIKPLEDVNG